MSKTGFEHGPQTYYDEDLNKTLLIAPEDEYTVKKTETIDRQREYFGRLKAIKSDTRHYVNCYHDAVTELNGKLDVNEMGAIMKLLPYMQMNGLGRLVYEGKRMGFVEIRKAIGKKKTQTENIVKSLIESSVLVVDKDGRRNVYNVAERYHTIGYTLKNRYYTKLYQVKTRTDVKDVSIQAAGVLYKMLPFFHYEKLYLCENPNAGETERIRHLTQKRLSELTNVSEDVINRGVNELKRYGFVMINDSFGAKVIKVNPDVMYRKADSTDDYTAGVRREFAENKNKADSIGSEDLDWLPF